MRIYMGTSFSVMIALGCASVLAPPVSALPLTLSEFGYEFEFDSGGGSQPISAYDADFRYYLVSGIEMSENLSARGGPSIATDFNVAFSIDSIVDNSGRLLSGRMSMIGESSSLGIANGTPLFSATVTDVLWDSEAYKVQVRAKVDFLSPALREATGPIKSLLYWDRGPAAGSDFPSNPWNVT